LVSSVMNDRSRSAPVMDAGLSAATPAAFSAL
jgi:hypothetical protein